MSLLSLPRLTPTTLITDKPASTMFQRFWDVVAQRLEEAFNGHTALSQQVNQLSGGVAYRDQDNDYGGLNIYEQPPESPLGYNVQDVKVVSTRDTGWTAGTGTPNKTAYAGYAGHVWGGGYVQADQQALDDAVKANARRILALEQALLHHGSIGP